jgi:DNA polymerase-3 subunit gamma/tau
MACRSSIRRSPMPILADGRVTCRAGPRHAGPCGQERAARLFAALLCGRRRGLLDLIDQQFALRGGAAGAAARGDGTGPPDHRGAGGQGRRSAASAEERAALAEWAGRLGAGQLHRLWQLLLKGHDEVRTAPDPLVAAKMALLRASMRRYARSRARWPASWKSWRRAGRSLLRRAMLLPPAPAAPQAMSWAALVELVDHSGQLRLSQVMHDWVRVIALEPGELTYTLAPAIRAIPPPKSAMPCCAPRVSAGK